MTRALPVWRSMLYVPVNVPRFVAGAADREADAIILDLEDAVAPAEKDRARTLLGEAIPQVSRRGADVIVRVNRPWRLLVRDLEAAVIPGVAALALPKTDSAEHVRAVAETVAELEAERGIAEPIGLVAMVETPGAFFRMEAIARAQPRLVALTVGPERLALSVGLPFLIGAAAGGRSAVPNRGMPWLTAARMAGVIAMRVPVETAWTLAVWMAKPSMEPLRRVTSPETPMRGKRPAHDVCA